MCRDIPSTLEPLLPWLQDDVPEEVLGVNPNHCLVFLAPTDWSDLPELPEPQAEDEDLPYIQDVTTPKRWVCLYCVDVHYLMYQIVSCRNAKLCLVC